MGLGCSVLELDDEGAVLGCWSVGEVGKVASSSGMGGVVDAPNAFLSRLSAGAIVVCAGFEGTGAASVWLDDIGTSVVGRGGDGFWVARECLDDIAKTGLGAAFVAAGPGCIVIASLPGASGVEGRSSSMDWTMNARFSSMNLRRSA